MKIESERLVLRRYVDGDFAFLHGMAADPEMVKYVGNGETRDRDGALRFLYWVYQGYKDDPATGLLLLERRSDGEPVGHAGLVPQKWTAPMNGKSATGLLRIIGHKAKRLKRQRPCGIMLSVNSAKSVLCH